MVNVEKIYQIGEKDDVPYRAVVGWSDTQQAYYACIETDSELSDIFWKLPPRIGLTDVDTIMAITGSVVEALTKEAGRFYPAAEDIAILQQAPRQREVDPSELIPIDMLDTDYAAKLAAEDTLALAEEQMVCMQSLTYCVSMLRDLQQREAIDDAYDIGSFTERRSTILAQTAADLVLYVEELNQAISGVSIHNLASSDHTELWDYDALLMPQEIERIDDYVQSLCDSRLTGFPQAISRGYNPVTGLLLDCPNPEAFTWEEMVRSAESMALYEAHGLLPEQARQVVEVQCTDPRYRSVEEWALLEETGAQLLAIAQECNALGEHDA